MGGRGNVEDLGLPARTLHALQHEGIWTVESLLLRRADELMYVNDLHKVGVAAIKAALAGRGLALAGEPPVKGYNVMTDEEVEFPPTPQMAQGGPQIRMRAIEAAVTAVREGVAFDVVRAAERYVAFALGKDVPEEPQRLPFRERLRSLLELEVLSGETDLEKLRHDVQEVFGMVEDAHWPKTPGGIMSDLIAAGVPPMKHTGINDPAGPDEGVDLAQRLRQAGMAEMGRGAAPELGEKR